MEEDETRYCEECGEPILEEYECDWICDDCYLYGDEKLIEETID